MTCGFAIFFLQIRRYRRRISAKISTWEALSSWTILWKYYWLDLGNSKIVNALGKIYRIKQNSVQPKFIPNKRLEHAKRIKEILQVWVIVNAERLKNSWTFILYSKFNNISCSFLMKFIPWKLFSVGECFSVQKNPKVLTLYHNVLVEKGSFSDTIFY